MAKLNKQKLTEVSAGFRGNVGRAQIRKLVGKKPTVVKQRGESKSLTGARFQKKK